jgi:hypothetical protein
VKLDRAAVEQARDTARTRFGLAKNQRERDYLTGYHAALDALYDTHFRFPVAPGTIMHGIDVSRLDWLTRAMVLSRNLGTIYALGGRPDPE